MKTQVLVDGLHAGRAWITARLSWDDPGRRAHLPGMKTATPPIGGLDPLLSIADLAEYLGVPVATIYDWRVDGKGPCGDALDAT